MSENFDRMTKAQIIELLKSSLAKKDLTNIREVSYDPEKDFPEREEHWKRKLEKQRIFNMTKGKGKKDLEVRK
jgi:hypothetical protein